MSADPIALIHKKTGNWWTDDRRHWCAYCGSAFTGLDGIGNKGTRDHVIPRAHKGRHVTIPACQPCNSKRGSADLPTFMLTAYFAKIREKQPSKSWSMRDLWLAVALAAVEQARSRSEAWPPKPADES